MSRGQPSDVDATLISGDSMIGEVMGIGRLGPGKHFGRYLVLGRLGAGEHGIVYAAYDPELDRRVAIKLLRPRGVEAFLATATAAAALAHPHLVGIREVESFHGLVFVVMDHVSEAKPLRDWIDEGPHPWPLALELLRKVAAALAAGHRAGLVHANVRPANVLLDAGFEPKLCDLGLVERHSSDTITQRIGVSRRLEDSTSADALASVLTPADQKHGGWAYVAPEQWSGELADERSDQFAFCVGFYEALYAERPFEGRSLQAVLLAIKEGRVRASTTKVPRWLRAIVVRGLAHDPEQRWPSMDALLDALDHGRSNRSRRVVASVAACVALLAGSVASMRAPAAERSASPPALCTPHEAELALASTWSPARRSALEQHVAEVGEKWAEPFDASLQRRIDAWAEAWQAEWIDACAATRVRGEQDEAALEHRFACLDRQRERIDAFTDALLIADADAVADALVNFESLDHLDNCRRDLAPLPDDPGKRERLRTVTAGLARARALQLAGHPDDAREQLKQLRSPVHAADWAPLVAEHGLLDHRLPATTTRDQKWRDADPNGLLPRSLAQAIAGGDDPLAVEITLEIAEGCKDEDVRKAWLELAGGLAERTGNPKLRAEVLLARGLVTNAMSLLLEVCDDDSPLLAEAELRLALAKFADRDHEAADAALERARLRWIRLGGEEHPRSLALLATKADFALARGHLPLAERLFAEVVERSGPVLVDSLLGLATARIRQGRSDDARGPLERAAALTTARSSPRAPAALAALALLEADHGELEAASMHAEQALERSADFDVAAEDRAAAHRASARVAYLRGDYDEASAELHVALREAPSPDADIDLVRVELARGDPEQARQMLATAECGLLYDCGGTPSAWHFVVLALLRLELCPQLECSEPDYDTETLARQNFAQLQDPDPALRAAFERAFPPREP